MEFIDGKKIAEEILKSLARELQGLTFRPLLADVLVGDNPVSLSYTAIKAKTARRIGCDFELIRLPAESKIPDVISAMEKIRERKSLSGLIVQLPLPKFLDKRKILDAIPSGLDIDCIGRQNLEDFYRGSPRYLPPTAAAVMLMIEELPFDFTRKNFLVIGRGELVGKPVAHLLNSRGLRVAAANSKTSDLPSILKNADIVISGTGRPGLVNGQNLKPGAVVIDAGTAESAGSIVGDVDAASVSGLSGWLSPVPGGVGPVTVAMLCRNLVGAAKARKV